MTLSTRQQRHHDLGSMSGRILPVRCSVRAGLQHFTSRVMAGSQPSLCYIPRALEILNPCRRPPRFLSQATTHWSSRPTSATRVTRVQNCPILRVPWYLLLLESALPLKTFMCFVHRKMLSFNLSVFRELGLLGVGLSRQDKELQKLLQDECLAFEDVRATCHWGGLGRRRGVGL